MCAFENKHQQDICSQEIGLRAQTRLTIIVSMVDMIKGPLWSINEYESLYVDNE